jgi:hypothetical protein
MMDEIKKEREEGLDWEYMGEMIKEREATGGKYVTPMAGLMGELFAVMAKTIIDEVGRDKGEAIIEKAVKDFGEERGRRVAERVKAAGKPLSLKNFLVFGDLDSSTAISFVPNIEDGDLSLSINRCDFSKYPDDWGMGEYFHYYCKYIDKSTLRGYNARLKLEVPKTLSGGDNVCILCYTVKEKK